MKILVFSDSHGETNKMERIINANSHTTDLVLHLGDRASDLVFIREKYPQIAFISVKGNNGDYFSYGVDAPNEYTLTLENRRFFMTHGHKNGVKSGELFGLMYEAQKNRSDVVLYGHTHIAKLTQVDNVYYFNPGSITYPRDASGGTYGIITLKNNTINFEIKDSSKEHLL